MLDFLRKHLPLSVKLALHSLFARKHFPLPDGRRALVFLSADYGNIGDLAISSAQRAFLVKALADYSVVPVPISATRAVLGSIQRQITDEDIVTTIGGGNMGSLYPDIEGLRQLVIRAFPRNRVVCFPQTLDWNESDADSKTALGRIAQVYSSHPDLHVFARESVSLAKLQGLFSMHPSVKVGLVPDIVLSATAPELGGGGCAAPAGALLCLRDDRERSVGDDVRGALHQALSAAGLAVEVTDTHAGGSGLPPEECARLLGDKITQFQGARLVVTDRLHGMILAALAGTPCLVLPNSNHKIRQTWMDWLRDVPQVRFLGLDELAVVDHAIAELLATPRRDPASPVIAPVHYDDLRAALAFHD